MITTDQLIADLTEVIKSSEKHIKERKLFGNKEWTEQIKENLGRLGESYQYKICASTRNKEYENEWLYDMVWYKENEKSQLIEVPLVVESEWMRNYKDVKFDFEKLLLANAQLKLIICNCSEYDVMSWVNNFQEAIEICPFVREGDTYLIAILQLEGNDAKEFFIKPIVKGSILIKHC